MSKLVWCNGKELEVREVGDAVVYKLKAGPAPIKQHGWVILTDDDARALVLRLREEGAEPVK